MRAVPRRHDAVAHERTASPHRTAPPTVDGRLPVIEAMTGIRALAAVWVVFYHFQGTLHALLPGTRVLAPVIAAGHLGVDVFFVLSGFIISYNYADRFASFDRASYRDFLVARVARVYPVHLLGLLMVAVLVAAAAAHGRSWNPNQDFTVAGFLGNVALLQAFPGVEAWNIPSWSITCEMAAYLAFPLLAWALGRLRRQRHATVLAAVLSAAVLASAAAALLVLDAPTATDRVAGYWVRIATEFTAGCLLWLVWRLRVRPGRAWDAVAVATVAAVVVLLAAGAAPVLAVPLLAVSVLASAGVTGPVRRLLVSRAMQWGGRISYSLYIVHVPVFSALLVLHSPRWFTDASLAVRAGLGLVYAVVIVVAAAVTHHVVEEPARRWLLGRRRRPVNATEPASTP